MYIASTLLVSLSIRRRFVKHGNITEEASKYMNIIYIYIYILYIYIYIIYVYICILNVVTYAKGNNHSGEQLRLNHTSCYQWGCNEK